MDVKKKLLVFVTIILYGVGTLEAQTSSPSNVAARLKTFGDFVVEPFEQSALTLDLNTADIVSQKIRLKKHGLVVRKVGRRTMRIARAVSTSEFNQSSTQTDTVSRDLKDDDLKLCKQLVDQGAVKSCSPNYEIYLYKSANDPRVPNQWAINKMALEQGWDYTTGSSEVVVAVIDTGIDYNHQDLAANVWVNSKEIASDGKDNDKNGYIDDIHGINAINGSGDPFDDNSHGTHVAGTIGALGNNALGVAGVNWQVKIMAAKFISASGNGASLADAIESIDYVTIMKQVHQVPVIAMNNSWGGGGFSQPLYNAIERANQAGIVFIAAAGNESNDNDAVPSYPANYDLPNVISVGATDSNDNMASFSNYGATSVDIFAPGVSILSTVPGNGYSAFSGTSMATPHVSGLVALIKAAQPQFGAAELITRVYESGVEKASLTGLARSPRVINAANAVSGQNLIAVPAPQPLPAPIYYSLDEIGYAPEDSSGMTKVLEADEGLYNFQLPFNFPFYSKNVSSLTLSTNGVAYARSQASADFRIGSSAPLYSIAALHADLIGQVYVKASAEKASILWIVKPYNQTLADSKIQLDIRPDGSIKIYHQLSEGSASYLNLAGRSIVGIAGATAQEGYSKLYTGLIRNDLAIAFLSNGLPLANTVSIKGLAKKLYSKSQAVVRVLSANQAQLSGETRLVYSNQVCSLGQFQTQSGKAKVKLQVPNVSKKINLRFEALVAGRIEAARSVSLIPKTGISGKAKSKSKKVSFDRVCSAVLRSLSKQK